MSWSMARSLSAWDHLENVETQSRISWGGFSLSGIRLRPWGLMMTPGTPRRDTGGGDRGEVGAVSQVTVSAISSSSSAAFVINLTLVFSVALSGVSRRMLLTDEWHNKDSGLCFFRGKLPGSVNSDRDPDFRLGRREESWQESLMSWLRSLSSSIISSRNIKLSRLSSSFSWVPNTSWSDTENIFRSLSCSWIIITAYL